MEKAVVARLNALHEAFARFRACADGLPAGRFLERMNGWSPRDVTAHLIGWNRHTIEGCREILRGDCPFYLADESNDFSAVNRESVERYASSDRNELLAELDTSFDELKAFLLTLSDPQWEKDFGVRYKGHVITVENNVEGLRMDYDRHREGIETWEEKAGR
jgi:hypothetical protein